MEKRGGEEQQNHMSLPHHLVKRPEGNEAMLAFQYGGRQGALGGANFASSSNSSQSLHQPRKFIDLAQQHGSPHMRDDAQNKSHAHEQQMMNPVHQAYLQYAFQAAQQKAMGMQPQQQVKLGMVGSSSGKDQDMRMANLRMQELIAVQANNQAHSSSSNKSSEPLTRGEKQIDQGQQPASDERNDLKPAMLQNASGQLAPANMLRAMQISQAQQGIQNLGNNQIAMAAQLQAFARECNIDLTQPGNANLVAQLIPLMQSRMAAQQNANEGTPQSSPAPMQRQQVTSPPIASENSPRANSSSEVSGQSGSTGARQAVPSGPFGSSSNARVPTSGSTLPMQQFSVQGRDGRGSLVQPSMMGNGMSPVQTPRPSVNLNQVSDHSLHGKSTLSGQEALQMQHRRQLNPPSPQPASTSNEGGPGNNFPQQAGAQTMQQRHGFTKQQLHVLKAQILAFRRIKKGESTLPQELLRAIIPPPIESQVQQSVVPSAAVNQDRSGGRSADENSRQMESNDNSAQALPPTSGQSLSKEEVLVGDEKANSIATPPKLGVTAVAKEAPSAVAPGKESPQTPFPVKPEPDVERGVQKSVARNEVVTERGKAIAPQVTVADSTQLMKPSQAGTASLPKDVTSPRKYHGPLFDFPFFTRKHDSFGSSMMTNNNLTLAYDIKDLLSEEGIEVLNNKRAENLKKIGGLLAVNIERKKIAPDLVVRLRIEEKKLRLLNIQARLRDQVDQEQQEIMAMSDREYRKFVRTCERQRLELLRQMQASQKAVREKQLKSIFQWRKKLLEAHWAIRDARTARNRGVAKYHERMLREFSKRKDDDRNKRMEALKNNDVERYREMLLEQQTSIPGDAAERYAVLSSFLTQTEDYLHKLGSKITAAKNQQEVEEAAAAAAAAARAQGLSEEEVRAAAACAGDEVMIRNQFSEMNTPKDNSSASKYYSLAHAVNERVARQPSMLRAGTLRDYQLVGLQWMLSLYNNKLNGILADEMGLGKTVQVMALIAYLMEFKGNYGPHLIIVPNAVLVNWKSEFYNWLPSVSCIFYVGQKDQRSKLFSQEVCAMKFNVLVTTYEFIMYDRSKLSKIDWKYIIIDEAQRMKDRESVLARDLDRYRCQRRLLLTGTPLQNDLKELWSLLNLLLPEVFDNRKAFHDWFSQPFQKEAPAHSAEDDWLETEKKVIIIHRLHQILEPFMLRRRVEDVEGSLPPKISIVLKCKMSPFQSTIYDWVKATGTLRVDPEEEKLRIQKNPYYQARMYKTLNNRCMELRKVCNHPLLSYPYYSDLSKDFLVRSCGKLWILDRILVKLQRTGHRVLLFSTMTKLLDIVEEYLQWRHLLYRRIDGTTSLEDRESAIVDFNSPDSECFIFLLSIRAAGRGLNLQTADTVVIYDPDPNPKNEEQAVARAHRIGQTREVKVIYMEAVVNKITSHQKEDEFRSGGTIDLEDDLAGKDRYMGSIESLIRNNIQQYKIDMADEVINAGRFDQRTTHEERRMTLETLLHDEERYQETVHDVPSLQEVNRMIARSEEEVELFDQMDEELDWEDDMIRYDQVPEWLRANTREVNATIASLSKKKPKDIFSTTAVAEPAEPGRRGRRKKTTPVYEVENESSDASSEDRNGYSVQEEEEAEIGDFEDDEEDGAPAANKDHLEEDGPLCNEEYEFPQTSGSPRNSQMLEGPASPASSSDSRRITRAVSPSISSRKFTTLSALDARPSSGLKRLPDELEEGEIAASGDSHLDLQQSGSWNHEREEGEDEQVLQPKIKRKRSIRLRPRIAMERQEERYNSERPAFQRSDSSQYSFQSDQKFGIQPRAEPDSKTLEDSGVRKQDQSEFSSKTRRSLPSRRTGTTSYLHDMSKPIRLNKLPAPSEDDSRESSGVKVGNRSNYGAKMSDVIQRKCKSVISKLRRRIEKEGHQIVPLLTDLWKRIEASSGTGSNLVDLGRIDQRMDRLEYSGIMEFVSDVQTMLRGSVQYYGLSHEVRTEARKVHDLFFDILKIAFPETDFREARNAISFAGPSSTSASASAPPRSTAAGQTRRHKLMNEVERETGLSAKPPPRGSTADDTRARPHPPVKEPRLGGNTSSRDQDESPLLTHPGELVVCKKKRKDREKSIAKPRTGSAGPVSPPSMGRSIKSPGSASTPRETRSAHQGWPSQAAQQDSGGGGGSVGWANPVKRLRTDAGRRRPSIS